MKKKVLIIEDEQNIANAEMLILKEEYEVHHAPDGEKGLKMIRELKPHLIVLDLMLPKRGGYDVCYHLREDDKLAGIKVLMVTAKNQEIDKEKGFMVGTDDYLTKPFEPEELLSRVQKILNR